jgi:hypoxanthine phosphoribosyltransferase
VIDKNDFMRYKQIPRLKAGGFVYSLGFELPLFKLCILIIQLKSVVTVDREGFIFLADLMREITIPVDMDLIAVSSYGAAAKSSGVVRILKDIDVNVTGKHVLIVEDLVDTGLTLAHLKEHFKTRGPESVRICTAFDKPSRRKVDIKVEYEGIIVPDKFIVGYGLDYAGNERGRSHIENNWCVPGRPDCCNQCD